MRRVSMLLVLGGVLLAVASPRADVAPFPSWRTAANGNLSGAVQAGNTIYVGGAFTKIGTALSTTSGVLDPATLTFTPSTGCAAWGTSPVYWRYTTSPSPTALVDGAGPFPLPAGTSLVRMASDCRFDRAFRVVLPPGVRIDSTADEIVEAGGHVYFHVQYVLGVFGPVLAQAIVEVDGVTGVLQRYWIDSTPYPLFPVGVTSAGRLVARTRNANGRLVIGFFDPATGTFDARQTMADDGRVLLVGSVVVVFIYTSGGSQEVALDAATLAPLPQWPVVTGLVPVVAAGGGRIYTWGMDARIDGVATRAVVAFDATTGARDMSWSAPALTPDLFGYVSRLNYAAGRLIVTGDFTPGAPRDTMAALDAATGALDPWVFPFNATFIQDLGARLYVPEITARDRASRPGLAALDASTGAVQPWSAAPVSPSALTLDTAGGYLYVGRNGGVDRVSLATGAKDTTWGLDLTTGGSSGGMISAMTFHAGAAYVTGLFDAVNARGSATSYPRAGIAAVGASGAVLPWQVPLAQGCAVYAKVPSPWPCVSRLLVSEGRIVMAGSIFSTDGSFSGRALMAVTADTGAVDPLVPQFPQNVAGVDVDATGLYLAVITGPNGVSLAAQITSQGGPRVIGPVGRQYSPPSGMAVRLGRFYADVERDTASGAPTGNAYAWQAPVSFADGVGDFGTRELSYFPAIAATPPRAPINLQATTDGARLTLRWSPGPGDLAPFVSPVPPGASAASSHIVLASLASGGAPVAQFDTASADTSFATTAPTGTFYLRVQAKNAFGTSAPSAELRVDVQPQAPNPPLATIASVSGRTVHIEWQAASLGWPATSYLLDAGTAPGLSNIGTLPVNGTTFDAPVPPGRYYVRIRAVNAYGASVPGDEVILDVP